MRHVSLKRLSRRVDMFALVRILVWMSLTFAGWLIFYGFICMVVHLAHLAGK